MTLEFIWYYHYEDIYQTHSNNPAMEILNNELLNGYIRFI